MFKTIKAAVVQAGPVLFDTPRTLAKLADLARAAAAKGAELVVFPEAFLGGYPKGLDFGVRLGMRSAEGREEFRRYYESAIDLPGPEAGYGSEKIEVAEIDRRIIARGKYDLDVVGHYARPDVFKLTVDTRPKPAVAFSGPVAAPLEEAVEEPEPQKHPVYSD